MSYTSDLILNIWYKHKPIPLFVFSASSNGIAQSNYDMMDSFQNAPVNKRPGKYYSTQNQGILIEPLKNH